jgi:hypothetical protein
MKITKQQLKDIIREELAEARESHQHFKFPNKRNAEDFAQEIANSALATGKVKGDTVAVDISKVRKARTHKAIAKVMKKFKGTPDFKITFENLNENSNKFFIVDPTGMRGEPAYYRRKSTNDDSQFEFSTLFGATGFDSKGSANTTMRRVKSSSQKYRRATLKVLRGDELHEDVDENRALDNAIANRDANRANRQVEERYEDLYLGLQKLIRQVSKNNKVKGYGGELTHAFVDLLYAVETDRLGVGEIFNGLKKINSKISKK